MKAVSESQDTRPMPPRSIGLVVAVCGLATGVALTAGLAGGQHRTGPVEYEVKSEFSHIRVRRHEDVRTLLFVNEHGQEVIESQVDLARPHRLLLPYTQYMFVSYLFSPQQQRALVVGLGGGGMIHFVQHFDPRLQLDVVEIDPMIIQVADKYFHARTGDNVRIINQDAHALLQNDGHRYDVIYMDAFLGASDETDTTGVPLHLKTLRFFEHVQTRLAPHGMVIFNLHRHRNHTEDVRAIRSAFPQAYVFHVPARGNVIVAASLSPTRLDRQTLRSRAAALDSNARAGFSFATLVENMTR
jgi:spermidine synthase